jgi:hypothetical protein
MPRCESGSLDVPSLDETTRRAVKIFRAVGERCLSMKFE